MTMARKEYENCIIKYLSGLSDTSLKRLLDYINYLMVHDFDKGGTPVNG